MTRLTRRRTLQLATVSSVAGLAGCLAEGNVFDQWDENGNSGDDDSSDSNDSRSAHTVGAPMSDEPDDDLFRITVLVDDEESVLELADCVDDVVDASVVSNQDTAVDPSSPALRIDVRKLTPKQWEALELAFDHGYYEQPRAVDLETLAAELSISKSAVSQRLRAAEATIVEAVLTEARSMLDAS